MGYVVFFVIILILICNIEKISPFGCLMIFFIVVIIVMTQSVIAGAGIIICSGIILLSLYKADEKCLSDIRDTQIFKVRDIIDICNLVKEEMGTSGYFNMPVAIVGNVKRDKVKDEQLYVEDETDQISLKIEVNAVTGFKDHNIVNYFNKQKQKLCVTTLKTINEPVYIIGEASDKDGVLVIKKSKDFNNPIIIVFASLQKYIQDKESTPKFAIASGIFIILIGIIFLILGILK